MPSNANNAMPGNRYFLDTNALVALLQGHQGLIDAVESADWVGLSVVTVLEFLGFAGLSEADRELFDAFVKRVSVLDLAAGNTELIAKTLSLRTGRHLKLPDAIIAASAITSAAILLTNDQQLLKLSDSENQLQRQAF